MKPTHRSNSVLCFYLSAWCLYVCAIFLITLIRPMWDDNPALDFYKCRENLCSISLNWAQNHNFFHAEAQTWRNADFARVQIEKIDCKTVLYFIWHLSTHPKAFSRRISSNLKRYHQNRIINFSRFLLWWACAELEVKNCGSQLINWAVHPEYVLKITKLSKAMS